MYNKAVFTTSILCLSTVAIVLLLYKTVVMLSRSRVVTDSTGEFTKEELPSVSVCIAARNEMHVLAQSLERVIQNDYPKLEILVLDDSSTDDTSLIIKSFAQAGVRFIPGTPLPDGWLGKNHAYQTLLDEASGDYVVFLDVDTILSSTAISQLISRALARDKAMMSVLPRREDGHRANAVLGTMRYYWQLLISSKSRPPAFSAVWVINKHVFTDEGIEFSDYRASVQPEQHIAKKLQLINEYFYIIGTKSLGVSYEKRLHSQYETAMRLYFPMSGRSWFIGMMSTIYMALLIAPLGVISAVQHPYIAAWSALLILLTGAAFGLFVRSSYGSIGWPIRVILGPVLLVQEFILLVASHVLYRLGRITWKGRSVTAQPVRHDALRMDE